MMFKQGTAVYAYEVMREAGQGAEKRKFGGFTLSMDWRAIRNEAYLKAIAYNPRLISIEIFN